MRGWTHRDVSRVSGPSGTPTRISRCSGVVPMPERYCAGGCTQECFDIAEERARRFEQLLRRMIEATRRERLQRSHEVANSGRRMGTLDRLGDTIALGEALSGFR